MTNMRSIRHPLIHANLTSIATAAAACLFAVGCGAAPYQIVRQTTPNPLAGKRQFVSMPIDYAGLHVGDKTEGEYLATKQDASADSFQVDKEAINAKFQSALAERAATNGITVLPAAGNSRAFTIKPSVRFIEPGFYAGIVSAPSKIEMTVVILDEGGTNLDEIVVQHGTNSGITNPASGQRLRSDGAALGGYVAAYLRDRVSLEK